MATVPTAPKLAQIPRDAKREPGVFRTFFTQLGRNPLGAFGLVLVILIVASAIFANFLILHDPTRIMLGPRLAPPSWAFLLGTDQIGRDTFSRVLMGGRVALLVAGAALGVALASGLALGLIASFSPRWLDAFLLLVMDTVRSFPVIIFALAVITLVGPSLGSIIFVVAITSVPSYGRIVRTQALALRSSEFITAERALGAGLPRILLVHVLPNVIGPLLILVSMDIPLIITLEAGLSFLGMGVRPPTPSWGSILNDGYSHIQQSVWLVIAGGIPLVLTTLGFTFLGEALRDIFDPKLRRDL
jgi:peptide/nickel transport system permease protein